MPHDIKHMPQLGKRPTAGFRLKSETQLEVQTLHRIRARLVGARTALINQLRAILLEHGIVVARRKAPLARRRCRRRQGCGRDARRHPNVVVVALAAKLARIAYAVLAHGRPFQTA